jgi:hypothetical protein
MLYLKPTKFLQAMLILIQLFLTGQVAISKEAYNYFKTSPQSIALSITPFSSSNPFCVYKSNSSFAFIQVKITSKSHIKIERKRRKILEGTPELFHPEPEYIFIDRTAKQPIPGIVGRPSAFTAYSAIRGPPVTV